MRWKESFNDENAFIDSDEDDLEGYDEESDYIPILDEPDVD